MTYCGANQNIVALIALLILASWTTAFCESATAAQPPVGRAHGHRFNGQRGGQQIIIVPGGLNLQPFAPYGVGPHPYQPGPPYYPPSSLPPRSSYRRVDIVNDFGPVIPTNAQAAAYQRQAEFAFRKQQYREAILLARHAIIEDDRNGKLHLFTSQAQFAIGDYRGASASLHQALSLLEHKDWGYAVRNYEKLYHGRNYVMQMERLNASIKENPNAVDARFVRGYHLTYLNQFAAAKRDLAKVAELEPRDKFALRLLEVISESEPHQPAAEELPRPNSQPLP